MYVLQPIYSDKSLKCHGNVNCHSCDRQRNFSGTHSIFLLQNMFRINLLKKTHVHYLDTTSATYNKMHFSYLDNKLKLYYSYNHKKKTVIQKLCLAQKFYEYQYRNKIQLI